MRRPNCHVVALAAASLAVASAAQAANLSMRFAGGASEVSLAPGQTAVIEIVWTMSAQGKTALNLGTLNNRFDVDSAAALEVTAVTTSVPGWATTSSSPVGGALGEFFASAEGIDDPIVETTASFETVVQEITIRNVDGSSSFAEIAFRVSGPLPDAITSTASEWGLVASNPGTQQFDIGQGSPGYVDINGDSNSAAPLIINFTAGTGGGGGGGGGTGDNTNDNVVPPANENDNTVVVEPNDNIAANDNLGTPVNDNAASNDNAAENDNGITPPDDGSEDNANENAADGGGDGGGSDNGPTPPSGGGGGGRGGGLCGIGVVVYGGWSLLALLCFRFIRRRSG